MENFGFSMLWYWTAYFLVTLIGVLHTVFNITVLHMKSMKDGPGMGEGYEKTKPWHPFIQYNYIPRFCSYLFQRVRCNNIQKCNYNIYNMGNADCCV